MSPNRTFANYPTLPHISMPAAHFSTDRIQDGLCSMNFPARSVRNKQNATGSSGLLIAQGFRLADARFEVIVFEHRKPNLNLQFRACGFFGQVRLPLCAPARKFLRSAREGTHTDCSSRSHGWIPSCATKTLESLAPSTINSKPANGNPRHHAVLPSHPLLLASSHAPDKPCECSHQPLSRLDMGT